MTTRLIAVSGDSAFAWRVREATTARGRVRGLRGRSRLAPDECQLLSGGLGLRLGASVHTFGMGYPIDVLFCDRWWTVVDRIAGMPPNRMSRWVPHSRHVVELPGGTLGPHPGVGDRVRLQGDP
ncbi:MAG TPA: DUF192 domain-containing protein [Actinomycetota bacterium]|nr:DUF192 domain-containing protein [Actinomycetota bacterium]